VISIKIIEYENIGIIVKETDGSLLDILREKGLYIYAPCGGKGKCGKCMAEIAGHSVK
jgi:uncharacterized 2Fe-2S/4Fe-4S cluster protein (DUF4445 family)